MTPAGDEISIPDDVVIDILLRLPAERVFECRRLSKFYRGLIESAGFIREHYDRSRKSRTSVIIPGSSDFVSKAAGRRDFLVDFDSTSTKPAVTVRSLISPNTIINELEEYCSVSLLGCCRGILCYNIVNRYDTNNCSRVSAPTRLAFWNPITGAYRRSFVEHDAGKRHLTRCHLGYDAVTDDLKVVKIMQCRETCLLDFVVYSSKTDSWTDPWRRMDEMEKGDIFNRRFSADDAVFVEGTNRVHMIVGFSSAHDSVKVLAFDYASDKFNLVSVPEWQCYYYETVGLSCLDDCLCVYYYQTQVSCLEVWMMKDHGAAESWTRIFFFHTGAYVSSIHPRDSWRFRYYMNPLIFVNNGRRQLLVLSNGLNPRLCLGDVEEGELREVLHVPEESNLSCVQNRHVLFTASHRQP